MAEKKMSKKEIKAKIKEVKEQFAAYHRGVRDEEIETHNGKPFTSPQVVTPKNVYNRKRMKKVSRDDY